MYRVPNANQNYGASDDIESIPVAVATPVDASGSTKSGDQESGKQPSPSVPPREDVGIAEKSREIVDKSKASKLGEGLEAMKNFIKKQKE